MAESVMRQGLTTWLKSECQQAGMDMLFAVFAADTAQLDAARLINPALQLTAAQDVENLTRSAVSYMSNLPLNLLTAEERRKVFDLQEELEVLLKEAKHTMTSSLMTSINEKVYDINVILRQYLLEKVVECQIGKPGEVKPERTALKELKDRWWDKGVEAGKTDTWMDIENTIKETAERHPEIKDAPDLIFEDVEQWKQTDHYRINYGLPMWNESVDSETYSEVEVMFWDGYVTGKKQVGKDIFAIASELVKGR